MDPSRQRRRDALFEKVIGLAKVDRPALLAEWCREDTELRADVEELLAFDDEAEGLLDQTAASMLDTPLHQGDQVGRYVVDTLIGEGGMAMVFKGHDPMINREVALKFLKPAGLIDRGLTKRFLVEIRALGQLSHPGIVRVWDVCEYRGTPVIVLELLSGQDLDALIAGHCVGDLPWRLDIARQLGVAMKHVHEEGILHRDLKPANVFVESGGNVKLLDFGIAGFDMGRATRTSLAGLTPEYLAPESLHGAPPTVRSDIYAYGVVLYELFAGTRLYSGTIASTLHRIANEPIPLEPLRAATPPAIVELVTWMTAKMPDERPQRFDDILAVLRRIETALAERPHAIAPRVVRTHAIIPLAVAALLIGLGSYGGYRWMAPPPPGPQQVVVDAVLRSLAIRLVAEGGAEIPAVEAVKLAQNARFRVLVQSEMRGFLYVFSEPHDGALLNVLFPSPTTRGGSSLVAESVAAEIPTETWLEFGDRTGVERLWFVWSRTPVPELESTKRWANEQDRGVIKDGTERAGVRTLLTRAPVPLVAASGHAILAGTDDPLVGAMLIEHR